MMSTNDYIRQAANKRKWHKYYSMLRPVSIGTHPKSGMMDFINYDSRIKINSHMVWAEIYYDRELTADELKEYEMIKA